MQDSNRINSLKNAITNFIYAFEDLKIFNNSYFKNVIKNIYKDKELLKNSTVLYGDIDKLNRLNEKFGNEIGNVALYNTVALIKKNIPNDAIMFRIAGDEFGIILNNCDLNQANQHIERIKEALLDIKNRTNTYGLGITLAPTEYKKGFEINDMLLKSEQIVEAKKNKNKSKSKSDNKWQQVYSKIDDAISEYIADFRLKNKKVPLTIEQIEISSKEIRNIAKNLLDNNEKIEKEELEEKNAKKIDGLSISQEDAQLINKCMNNEKIDENNSHFRNSLRKVFDACIKNPNTQLFSRKYFEKILHKKLKAKQLSEKKNYDVIYFHTSGLKISNTINGHTKTDEKLKELALSISNSFDKEFQLRNGKKLNKKFFNFKPLSFNNSDNFLIDFNSGNFVAIIDEDNIPKNFNVDNFIEDNIKFNNNEESLFLNVKHKQVQFNEDLLESIKEIHKNIKQEKPNEINLLSNEPKYKLRVKILEECTKFFTQNIDYKDNYDNENKFLNHIEQTCQEKLSKISEFTQERKIENQ